MEFFYPDDGHYGGFGTFIAHRVKTETLKKGTESFVKSYVHDTRGFRTSQTVYGITTTFWPTAEGDVAWSQVTGREGALRTNYDYRWGVVKNVYTPEYTITRAINEEGTVASEERRGETTTVNFQYDGLNRLMWTNPPAISNPTHTTYAADGTTVVTERGSSKLTTSLDGFGRTTSTQTKLGVTTHNLYDACGRQSYQSLPFVPEHVPPFPDPVVDESGTTLDFDALDRVTNVTNPDQTSVTLNYSPFDPPDPLVDVKITDEQQRVTKQDWNAYGDPDAAQLASVIDAENKATSYEYNGLGALTRVTPPAGQPRTWEYLTGTDRVKFETHPENGQTYFEYDPNGAVKSRTEAYLTSSPRTTVYTYDRNNRLKKVDRPGAPDDVDITYDASDNRTNLKNGAVFSDLNHYDEANRLRERQDLISGSLYTTRYDYDGNDNIETIYYPSGTRAGYHYDADNRLDWINDGGSFYFAHAFQHHPSGAVSSFTAGNGGVHSMTFDTRYRPWGVNSVVGATTVLGLTYAYHDAGNVKTIADTRGSVFDQRFDFTDSYDQVDRLRHARGPWDELQYSYDAIGNRTSKTTGSGVTTYTINANTNRLTSTTGAEVESFGYDDFGNLRSDGRGTYTYNKASMMASATATATGLTTNYLYDGDDLRKVTTTPTGKSIYIHGPGNAILSEFRQQGASVVPVKDYVYGAGRLIASVRPPVLLVSPSQLTFASVVNQAALQSLPLTITAEGANVNWTIEIATPSPAWLSVSASSGTTPGGAQVTVNPTGLAVGTYVSSLRVTSTTPNVAGSPRDIPVRLVITATDGLAVQPADLRFVATLGVGDPAPQLLDVVASGTAPIGFSATTTTPWLTLAASGSITPQTIEVSVSAAGLDAGTYRGWLTVRDINGPDIRIVPVTLTVQADGGGSCADGAWYCEPFDELQDGVLNGQGGWVAAGEHSSQVLSDPRGSGRVLLIDPPGVGEWASVEGVEISSENQHTIEGSEIHVQVMSTGVPADNKQISKIEFLTSKGNGWGKTGRTWGALRWGSRLYLQWGANIYQVLVDQLESGRWYDVRVVYQFRDAETEAHLVYAYVDGELRFTTSIERIPPTNPLQGFAITGWDFPGQAYLDMIEHRPQTGGLVVEPAPLLFAGQATPKAQDPALAKTVGQQVHESSLKRLAMQPKRMDFEPNRGQTHASVRFLARAKDYALFLTADEFVLAPGASRGQVGPVRLRFAGAKPRSVQGSDPQRGRSNYLRGRDPAGWVTDVPHFGSVKYEQMYEGVDLVAYARDGELEYDLLVAPGADPRQVRILIEGAKASLDEDGDLLLSTSGGWVTQKKPLAYQQTAGERQPIEAGYSLEADGSVRLNLGDYDRTTGLVVDPVLAYSTYLGGCYNVPHLLPDCGTIATTVANGVAVSEDGEAVVVGWTDALDFPVTPNALQIRRCETPDGRVNSDAFVAKLSPGGNEFVFSTYIGGCGDDRANGVAVDSSGRIYVVGATASSDFPVTEKSYQTELHGVKDAFALRLWPDGAGLDYSTYLGGTGPGEERGDEAHGVAAGPDGAAVVVGTTDSVDFPLSRAFLPTFGGDLDAFVARLASDGKTSIYSSYLGGSGFDAAYAVVSATVLAVNGNPKNVAYVTGETIQATGGIPFPTTSGAAQTAPGGPGTSDAFVARILDAPGQPLSRLAWSTLMGGEGWDSGRGIALLTLPPDPAPAPVVFGGTGSADFWGTRGNPNPIQGTLQGEATLA